MFYVRRVIQKENQLLKLGQGEGIKNLLNIFFF